MVYGDDTDSHNIRDYVSNGSNNTTTNLEQYNLFMELLSKQKLENYSGTALESGDSTSHAMVAGTFNFLQFFSMADI